jgi:hypothetical protein
MIRNMKILVLAMLVVGVFGAWQGSAWAASTDPRLLIDVNSITTPIAPNLIDVVNGGLVCTGLTSPSATYGDVKAAVRAARTGGGSWTGTNGITSSAAALTSTQINKTGLAPISVTEYNGLTPSRSLFEGETLTVATTPLATMIFYTWYGDVNLDGTVNTLDLTRIQNGIRNSALPKTWTNGDVNLDGAINTLDLTIVQNSIRNHGSTFTAPWITVSGSAPDGQSGSSSGITETPEPASFVLLSIAFIGGTLVWWKKKRK